MMKVSLLCYFILLVCLVLVAEYKCILIQEKLEIEYYDKHYLDVLEASLSDVNQTTKVLNLAFMIKTDVPDLNIFARGLKSIKDKYRLELFHYDTTLQKAMEMEYFDLQNLYLKYTRPPFIWPLQKNVIYRSLGWTPDYNNWLPNFPEGKWKFQITQALPNNTKIVILNWFCKIQNRK